MVSGPATLARSCADFNFQTFFQLTRVRIKACLLCTQFFSPGVQAYVLLTCLPYAGMWVKLDCSLPFSLPQVAGLCCLLRYANAGTLVLLDYLYPFSSHRCQGVRVALLVKAFFLPS